jgi:tetratricopeptide (TPR) repeat protein
VVDLLAALRELETRTDEALGTLEQNGQWQAALAIYQAAGAEVDSLGVPRRDPAFRAVRKLRAYLYLREANALRALGRHAEALPLAEQELSAAMASGHQLSIARAMFSLGSTCLANGEVERGLKLLADSRPMFEHHDDPEHRQGLGWWHIIQADIGNEGLAPTPPEYALQSAEQALAILRPLENWPGVERAHAARAKAYQRLGDEAAARVARAAAQMAAARLTLPKLPQ